jgi:hypothetical protein
MNKSKEESKTNIISNVSFLNRDIKGENINEPDIIATA